MQFGQGEIKLLMFIIGLHVAKASWPFCFCQSVIRFFCGVWGHVKEDNTIIQTLNYTLFTY